MILHRHVAEVPLEDDPLDPADVVEGSPTTRWVELWSTPAGSSRGIWEITPGVVTDVEADEMFVVLSGRATIEIVGGATLDVGPGDVVLLEEGARTTWTVHETLRKVFHIHRAGDRAVDGGAIAPNPPAAR
jgi:uncharacterized cupin superfamily protein